MNRNPWGVIHSPSERATGHQDLPGADIVSDLAPFFAIDAGHEECAQQAYYDPRTSQVRCGCGVAVYTLKAVA